MFLGKTILLTLLYPFSISVHNSNYNYNLAVPNSEGSIKFTPTVTAIPPLPNVPLSLPDRQVFHSTSSVTMNGAGVTSAKGKKWKGIK